MGWVKNLISVLSILVMTYITICAGGSKPSDEPLIARRVSPVRYKKSDKDMTVTFIDVGQGNAVFIKTPSGATMLYDGGGSPEWMGTSWDPGMEVVVPYLKSRNIKRIDYVVISHAHGDHIGGFKAVINNFEVRNVIDPGFFHDTMMYKNLLKLIDTRNINYKILRQGDGGKINLGSEIEVEIFNPQQNFYFQGTNSDPNNNSILMRISYNKVSFLLTGDLEQRGEIFNAKKFGSRLESNVLQVGHHGSFTSSTRAFLNKVMPEVAVIPVGAGNVFGHPRAEALNNLASVGAEIYRTDLDGHVTVFTNGITFIVETEK